MHVSSGRKRTLHVYLALKNKSKQKNFVYDVLSHKRRVSADKALP